MNLAWIAAVLAPNDVAPRPATVNEETDPAEHARLADLVLGRSDPGRRSDGDPALRAARRALYNDTVRKAVPELVDLVNAGKRSDPARSAGYGLLLCSAAAELDDYKTCFDTLDSLLQAVSDGSSDGALVRAALLQQRALRSRDVGRPHLESTVAAASALLLVRPADCTPFPTNSPERPFETVIETMIDNLRASIGSLVTLSDAAQEEYTEIYGWRLTAQRQGTELTRRATTARAETYADYVQAAFKDEFDRRRRIFQSGSYADLFVSTLFLELAGHGNVYRARRELAVLRLMQLGRNVADAADALRLLRHATAKNDLTFVLRAFVDTGPLAALAVDARQILRMRSEAGLLRHVELQVLRAAADLLTEAEARPGLDAVLAVLDAGGPPDLPGQRLLPVLRRSVAWSAAAALSNVCGRTSDVADLLLGEARNSPVEEDQTFDAELRRAVDLLDWELLDADQQEAWLVESGRLAERLPATMALVSARAGRPAGPAESAHWLERLAVELNNVIREYRPAPTLSDNDITSLREALSRIRADAATGQFAMGGLEVADIATAAAIFAGAADLWPDVTGFLLDVRVARDDRRKAFDRLANIESVPESVTAALSEGIRPAVEKASAADHTEPDVPFAAALRFGAVHGLLPESEVYGYTARLLGSTAAAARIDGARTIATLAGKGLFDGLVAMLLPFAEDENGEVRAMVAVALVQAARHNGPMRTLVLGRITEMLRSDGVLLPKTILKAVAEVPDLMDPESWFFYHLVPLVDHPADSVRRQARKVLR